MSFWNPLTCITGCLVVYSIGEILSKKTKGAISSLLFACVLFLAGFWSRILPDDITTQSGLVTVMSNFGTAFMITNIGTLINLEDMIREWKTVVIALVSIGAIALICFTVGSLIFGRGYALIAAPPVAGSTVAGIIVTVRRKRLTGRTGSFCGFGSFGSKIFWYSDFHNSVSGKIWA